MTKPEDHLTLEDMSCILFSSKYKLSIIGAIGRYATQPQEPFSIAQIRDNICTIRGREATPTPGEIWQQIDSLTELQMVVEVPPEMASDHPENENIGIRTYVRVDAPEWPILLPLIESWSKPPQRQLNIFDDMS